jgi:hypothetical protein
MVDRKESKLASLRRLTLDCSRCKQKWEPVLYLFHTTTIYDAVKLMRIDTKPCIILGIHTCMSPVHQARRTEPALSAHGPSPQGITGNEKERKL